MNKIFILIFGITTVIAQDIFDENNFGNSYEDFTQSPITTILKDYEGFVWIGTYGDGLFKYNSIEFENYKQQFKYNNGAINNFIIHSIIQDSQNNLWIGTQQGLNKYNRELDRFENIKLSINNKDKILEIHAIKEFDENTLLIGTHRDGLYKLNKKDLSLSFIPFINKNDNGLLIESILKTKKGELLIASNYGVLIYDPENENLKIAKFETENGQEAILNNAISMFRAKDNSIWIGTDSSGLFKVFEHDGIYKIHNYPITEKRILSLSHKGGSLIVVGTENDGLFIVDCNTGESKNFRYNKLNQNLVKSNSIWTVYADNENKLWIGYYRNGIDLYNPLYNKFKSIKSTPHLVNSLNSNSVTGIIKDNKGRLWIGLNDGGLDVYDPKESKFTNLSNQNNQIATGLDKLDIQTVFLDRENNLWIGTWLSGLYILKNGSKRFSNVSSNTPNSVFTSNRIMSFDEDSSGMIWIGTYSGGLYSYDRKKNKFVHYNFSEFKKHNLENANIRKLIVDHEDNIWLATLNGPFKVTVKNNSSYHISSIHDLINKKEDFFVNSLIVNSLFEDREDNIWIGTLGYGLYKYDPKTQSIDRYNSENGLIHDQVNLITQDYLGSIWIGGNKGLTRIDQRNNELTNFSKRDGLLSNNFNFNSVYNSNDGSLYFGNSKGVNYFNPNEIITNNIKPKVYINNVKISNEDINLNTPNTPLTKVISKTKELKLKHYQSVLTIEYAGINYTRSENNKYAYYLEGYETDWNYVGSDRSTTYKNLDPGKYTFKVKAANNDGVWEDTPTTLDIHILTPWWASNIIIFCYILILVSIFYVIFRSIKERVRQKRVINFEREKHKQFEALNDKKLQFFTNISHEFRTPLTLILTPLEDLLDNFGQQLQFTNGVKDKLFTIQKNAKRLSRLINELMDFRKFESNKMTANVSLINTIPFVQEVVEHFQEEASQKNIILNVEYDDNDVTIWFDPTMLEKIIFNLLSNAFKATPDGGLITVQITKDFSSPIVFPLIDENNPIQATELIIKDTGIGIKKENIDKVFDRFHQADEMNDQYYGGTGIGLELVKNFIDLHKAKILLESELNEGTQFKIYFPQNYSGLEIDNNEEKTKDILNRYSDIRKSIKLDEDQQTNKKTILIVEDNTELRSYLKKELSYDYNVKEASNGLEGLEKADKFIPDIIITDVIMPMMDGFEFCKRIKTDLKTSHIPLLMITAKGLQNDRVRGIDSGADIYLSKPFSMRVLKSHLKQLITIRQVLFEKYFNGNSSVLNSENITSIDKEFINNVITYINENIEDENLNVESLANKLFLSRSKLYRKIKALTGDTANEFIKKIRLEKAKNLIENTDYSISEISFKVGFSSPSYFTKCFKDYFEILPTEIRDQVIS